MGSETGYPITLDEWFGLFSRGDLRDFQDCFAAETGIALSLVGRAGDTLIVPSRDKWFCRFSLTHFSHTCNIGVEAVVPSLVKRYDVRCNFEPVVMTCDFGLTEFYVPVYFDNRLMAFWAGGGFVLSGQYRAHMLHRKFDVTVIEPEEFRRNLRRLVTTTRLLNIRVGRTPASQDAPRRDSVFEGKLTRREREVAQLVCRGLSNREVAQRLFLSEKTVKSHITNILSKLGVRDRAQLMFEFANRHGEEGMVP